MSHRECHRPGARRGPLFVLLAAFLLLASASACSDPAKARAEHIARGEAYLKERNFQAASLEFRNAAQIDDKLADAHWGLARAYEGLLETDNSLGSQVYAELQRAVALDPNHLDARVRLGNYLILYFQATKKTEFRDQAERLAGEVLQKDPNHIEGHILRGTILFAKDDRAGALGELTKAVELDPQRVESLMSLALYHRQTGDAAKAEEVYRRAFAVNDKSALAHLEYARFNVGLSRLDVAEEHFRRAVDSDPQSREAKRTLASFYIQRKQFDRAEEVAKSLAALDGDKPEGRSVLAEFYAQIGRADAAVRVYQEIVQQSPDYAKGRHRLGELLMGRGDLAGAGAQVKEVLDKNPNDQQARLLRARLSLGSGDAKAAIEDLKEVLKQDQRHQLGLYYMAEANLRAGQIEQARIFASDLERSFPAYLPAKLMQVQIDLAAGEWQAAQRQSGDLLARLDKLTPDLTYTPELIGEMRAKTLTARAYSHLQLKNNAAARADFSAARDLDPNSPGPYVNLAAVSLAEGKADEAAQHYDRALSIDPANYDALAGVINSHTAQARRQGGGAPASLAPAHERVDRALQTRPQSAALHFLKAQIYGVEQNAGGAEAALRRALELDGSFVPAFNALGALYINTGKQGEAIAELARWAERRKDDPNPHVLSGMVYDAAKRYDEACEAYRKALALRSDDVFASNNLAWNYAEHGKGNLDEAMRLAQGVVQKFPDEPGFADTLGWVYFKKGLHTAAVEQLQKAVNKTAARGNDAAVY
ncbi:MAG: tetratricopeptide repeat protein, partial [Acidobacteria bacterium]|nr:tetratricopeptide repeat protein [Acidobacteriota bacterium]